MKGFNPCAIIPVYNHGSTTKAVVENLLGKGLPVILVDDGSQEETKKALREIIEQFNQCYLFTLERNLGKGGAVMFGLKEAFRLGFSHALQVDADGQHDLGEIDLFIEESRNDQSAMICGYPVYDESVPKSRVWGRKIVIFFVSLETLSHDIVDAMCGFRVYPLDITNRLITRKHLKKRMEFDIEILVRLHWMGLKLKFYPVKVIYPENGISHFRMFHDNVAISALLIMLNTGMVLRFPVILWKKFFRKNEVSL